MLALTKHDRLFEETDSKIELLTIENTLLQTGTRCRETNHCKSHKEDDLDDSKIEELQTEQAESKESRLNRVATRRVADLTMMMRQAMKEETETMEKERSAIEASISMSWTLT